MNMRKDGKHLRKIGKMIKMKGHIKFEKDSAGNWDVKNKKDEWLGYIAYEKRWKRHVFYPDLDTYFDKKCLQMIVEKLTELDSQNR